MVSVFISLAVLGLSAVDPVGIAVMPIILVQERPYRRAFIFLGGSFVSLMVAGVLFAKGLGQATLRFEQSHAWLVPGAEVVAGVLLLAIAAVVFVRFKTGKSAVEPSARTHRWAGALLVAVQSIVDVVFAVAMVRIGQLTLSGIMLLTAVATYALSSLLFQAAVVGTIKVAPAHQKTAALDAIQVTLTKYGNQSLIVVSVVLGLGLLALALVR
jgi:hypothetical protein